MVAITQADKEDEGGDNERRMRRMRERVMIRRQWW
jgi:hypothetical protein